MAIKQKRKARKIPKVKKGNLLTGGPGTWGEVKFSKAFKTAAKKKAAKSIAKDVAGKLAGAAVGPVGTALAAVGVYKAGKKGLRDRKYRISCEKKGGVWQKGYCITRSSKKKK